MTKGLKEDFMKAKAVTHLSTVALKTWSHDTLPFHDQSFHDCYVYQKCTKYRDKWTKCVTNYKAKKWKNVMGARSSLSAADHGPHLSITVPRVPFNHPQWRLPEKYFQWGWKFHFETYQNIPIQNNCAQSTFKPASMKIARDVFFSGVESFNLKHIKMYQSKTTVPRVPFNQPQWRLQNKYSECLWNI